MQLTTVPGVKRTQFADWPCAIARTIDLVGDWWTPLILREAYYGVHRFDDFESSLGLGRNVLTQRLKRLVKEGMFERRRYADRPPRFEYLITAKARAFFPVLAAMMRWGDEWLFEASPIELYDRHTGKTLKPLVVDEVTKQPIDLKRVRTRLGPGFPAKLRKYALASGRYGPPTRGRLTSPASNS